MCLHWPHSNAVNGTFLLVIEQWIGFIDSGNSGGDWLG